MPADTGPISPNDTRNYVTVAMTLQKTTARGNVSINSTDTAQNPLVNTNCLGTSTDQQLAIQGIKRAREIIQGFAEIVNGDEVVPGKGVQSDAQILEYLRETVVTIHHASTTCEFFYRAILFRRLSQFLTQKSLSSVSAVPPRNPP